MPDLDSLSIQIKASTTDATHKIDDLIASLGRLNSALNNYSESSDYVRGMNTLTNGLKGISSAINSINLDKIKNLTSAFSSLAGAGERITKLNFVSTFAQLGSETQKINSAAANTTKQLMEMFNIPKSYKGQLNDAVKTLYQSSNNPTVFNQASQDITRLVNQAQKAKSNMSDVYRDVRRYLNTSKLYISNDIMQHWNDSAKSNRATIGIANTTTDLSQATLYMEEMAQELRTVYGVSIDVEHGIEGMADSLVEFLQDESNIYQVHTDLSQLSDILDELRNKILGTAESFNTMAHSARVDEEGFMIPDMSFDLYDFEADADRATNAVQNVTAAVSNLEAQTKVEIANPFEGLIKGLDSLKDLEIPAEKFAGVTTLAASLGKFGSKNATNAITVIPQVGRAFAQMASELAAAPTISDNLVRMAEALSKYSRSATKATTETNRFGTSANILRNSLNGLNMPTLRSHRGFLSLASIFGRLYANFFLLIRGARLLGKAMDYSSSMTEAQNVVSVVFGKSSEVMDNFAKTAIKDFGLAKLSSIEFASRFQAMGKTMGITAEQIVKANDYIVTKIQGNARAYQDLGDSVADMSINLTKLTADIASLYNQDYEDVAKDMQAIYTGMTRPLRKYGLDLTNATLKEWAMSQGLESNIEKMSQAEKTMLRYQYVMSRAAGAMGDFQKTQDTWANSLRTVKQLLQEVARMVGEALINALRPALLAFKNFLFNFLQLTENALNALGKLLGWHQIDFGGASLIEDTEDYAEALDDAAGAAKKLKGQLRGIDELNNLTTNKGSGRGAGGSSGLGAGIDSIWDQIIDTDRVYESNVKDWKDFGQRIANAMKSGLASVNWEEVYKSSSEFGTNFASFLNGLIDPELWHLFGQTIAGGIMTAIEFAFAFGEEFDFENLGTAIAEGINGFFKEFDGGKLADTLNVWVDGLKTTLKTAAEKIDWKEIFSDLFDFFNHLDIDTIGVFFAVGGTILGLKTITTALASAISAQPLTLGAITIAAIGGFKIGNWLGEQWEEALGTNPDTGETYWYEFWEKVFDNFKGIGDWYIENKGRSLIWSSLANLFTKDGWDTFKDTGFYKISDTIATLLSVSDVQKYEGDPPGIIALNKIVEIMTGNDWTGFMQKITPLLSGVVAFGDPENVTGINNVGAAFGGLGTDMSFAEEGITNLTERFGTFKEDTAKLLEEWWENDVAPKFDLEKWTTLVSVIKDSVETVWNDTVLFWGTEVPNWIENTVKPMFSLETWLGYLSPIKDAFSQVWGDALGFAKSFWNTVSDFIEGVINGTIDGFGKIVAAKDLLTGSSSNFNVTHVDIPKYATGGFPQMGSLFWANEAGPELVGTMNGKTAVASNNEITGITAAIYSASESENALLRQQNALLEGILNKETGISKNDLFKSVQESAREFTNSTGKLAF